MKRACSKSPRVSQGPPAGLGRAERGDCLGLGPEVVAPLQRRAGMVGDCEYEGPVECPASAGGSDGTGNTRRDPPAPPGPCRQAGSQCSSPGTPSLMRGPMPLPAAHCDLVPSWASGPAATFISLKHPMSPACRPHALASAQLLSVFARAGPQHRSSSGCHLPSGPWAQ